MTETEARTFREAASGYVNRLNRMTKAALDRELRADLADSGDRVIIFGGPRTKDEYISRLMELHYPNHKHNETTHVLYHPTPEQGSSACDWCHGPFKCGNCGAPADEDCRDWCGATGRVQPSALAALRAES